MPYRSLLAFPLLWAALYLALSLWLLGTPAYATFLRTEIELAKVVATAGALAAALAFRPGEYLRRAWFLVAGSTAFFLIRDATMIPIGFDAMGETPLLAVRAVLVTAGNASIVAGVFMLARTWRVAGLTLPGRPGRQLAVLLVAAVLAFSLAGPAVVTFGGRLLSGDLAATAGVASALGDTAVLVLIAPLFLTALALRGGLFVWPWALLTASCVSWLFYDGFYALGPTLGLSTEATRVAYELFRALGCTLGASAGMAQRLIARGRTLGR